MPSDPANTTPAEPAGDESLPLDSTEREILVLKRRLIREATLAISMLESALVALWALDAEAARAVRLTDDNVDMEEVQIERRAQELLALHHPFGRDFRVLIFILKVNAELERVADHASGIAKQVAKIQTALGSRTAPRWPTALLELGERVPEMCHRLIRAVLDEDTAAARRIVADDAVIDQLEKRLFDEAQELMKLHGRDDAALTVGMLIYRIGRELERVGDLMAGVAEDVVYVATGEIIRHEKRHKKAS
ncbi:MAG: hypothetical protein JSR77_03550 [Planctomycetes bacterium]|nr:hypothetical protein [Planctomycetota bacterium]